jgi:surface polysaccharide O-acyltransferase-like enzyme
MAARVIWIDFAKVMAAFCVVLIHVVATEILKQDFEATGWQIANLLDSFSRFAPPLFFMTSGAMLLGRIENAGDFYRKRMSKILIPFLFWSLLFLSYKKLLVPSLTIQQLFIDLIKGDAYFHLWFVNAILFLYLLTPAVRIAIARYQTRHLIFAVFMLFALSSYGILVVKQYLFLFKSLGHLAYFVTGYLLMKVDISKSISIPMVIISATVTAFVTYLLSTQASELDLVFYEYTSPNTIILSIFVYLLVKKFDISSISNRASLVNLSSLTLGIYLIHPLFLNAIKLQWLYDTSYIVWVLTSTGLVFFLSFATVKIISKIKYLNKII